MVHRSSGPLEPGPDHRCPTEPRRTVSCDVAQAATHASAASDATADLQDGLRLSWQDRWVHVRPSGTEPIVRVIAEARTEEAARELVSRAWAPIKALRQSG